MVNFDLSSHISCYQIFAFRKNFEIDQFFIYFHIVHLTINYLFSFLEQFSVHFDIKEVFFNLLVNF